MKILKCILSSFGKFTNKEIEFSNGLNLITGLNESGKSTIHKFIEGMFFGFLESNKTRKVYKAEYDLYKPRHKNEYYGSMIILFENNKYLIERNFLKNHQSVTVTNLDTGTDITNTLDLDNGTKLPDLTYFLKINQSLFTNTVSVSQLFNQTDKTLSEVLVEKLTNMHSTKDEFISLTSIIKNIDDQIEDIGTTRAPTKPLAKALSNIDNLKNELTQSTEIYNQINQESIELLQLKTELKDLENSYNKVINQIKIYDNYQLYETYNKAILIKEQIDKYTKLLEPLMKYKDINEDDYNKAIIIESEIKAIKQRVDDLNTIISSSKHQNINLQELKKDYIKAKGYDQRSNQNPKPSLIFLLISLFSIIAVIPTKLFIKDNSLNVLIPLIAFIVFLTTLLLFIYFNQKNKELNEEKSNLNKILEKYEIINITDLEALYHKHNSINEQYNTNKDQLAIKNKQLQDEIQNQNKLFLNNKVNTLEELKDAVSKNKEYHNNISELKHHKERLSDLIKNQSLDDYKQRIDLSLVKVDIPKDIDNLKIQREDLNKEILDKTRKIQTIESNINYLESNNREVRIIETDLQKAEDLHKELNDKSKAYKLAKKVLEDLGEEIRYEFAPKLNEEISKIIKRITNNKYNDIKLDRNIDIKMYDTQTNSLESIKSYSTGTIDQIYISMRLGIINLISNQSIPLFFDDSFVNYDILRLTKILEYLEKESQNRQIILFTCHHREQELLNKDINIIEL